MKNFWTLVGVIAISVLAAVFIWPGALGNKVLPWRLGLDLIGGTQLIYEVDMTGVQASDRNSVLAGLRDVMERRVNVFGVSEPQVYTAKEGDSRRVIVELAGIKDPKEAIDNIGRTAQLDFRVAVATDKDKITFNQSVLTGRYLKRAQATLNPQTGQPEIAVEFNSEGARIFEELTGLAVGKQLGIFLDSQLISAPVVREKIVGGNAIISGQFTTDEARTLASLLNAGALPAPVKLLSQQTIGASLGADSLNKTIFAGLIGTAAVMLFMLVFYRKFGFFAAVALMIYIALTLGVFKLFSITMTLAGIAGFVLSIGMAVDANILIFERTKEEIKKGLSRLAAIEEGFKRAWLSVRDSNITTIITSVILYYFTSGFVRGFALALLLGVVISMFSAISVTRTLLRAFVRK